ncbi:Cytosine/adenosine deaminase [Thermanaeromonas toyohensis ToBE]|uniref:5-methylthioadenosine/S-adenosylhomocysteine deaminase n=1 Tax=Thermanaeromonas toyohensis ToBE TaxID=698762 RepID=A0A1W1W1L3_9FIRM|nr:5'-deoxyadenosine deaminase [Thermanaeromonas toyohensis]SMB99456.1 Cytosine/adenosine deaminase [Thermanaeromonas toyohensis ToBE]
MKILIKNGILVTLDRERRVFTGDLYIAEDRIAAIGQTPQEADLVIDASGQAVLPGLVQTHVHLCQTLFRGQADDLALLDWLKKRIWPLEGAHDEESLYTSALLGCAEMLLSGTTTILDMETVHYTEAAFKAIEKIGIRATSGKAMMDAGEGVPSSLQEDTDTSLAESLELYGKWHGAAGGRIRYAFAPRFVLSCSPRLLQEVGEVARKYGVLIHTHASENRDEVRLVEELTGRRNVIYLHELGLTGPYVVLAHCIWLDEEEKRVLAQTGTQVAHCPSCNLKLGSGIAPIPELLEQGVNVTLGADGAPCNNNLDMFKEMHLAALIQKPLHGPTSIPAQKVVEMATLGGARALGLEQEIGSLEVGKKADVIVVDLREFHQLPEDNVDIYGKLVYATRGSDVTWTIVDGQVVVANRQLLTIDTEELRQKCNQALRRVKRRAGLE